MKITIEITRPTWLRSPSRKALTILLAAVLTLTVPIGALATDVFSDVPGDSIFHNAISAIAGAGITNGCGGTNFCPSANVTREQMAMFLYRGLGRATYTPLVPVTIPLAETPAWQFSITAGLPSGALAGATGRVKVDVTITVALGSSTGCPCGYRGILFANVNYMAAFYSDVTLYTTNQTAVLAMTGLATVTTPGVQNIEVRLWRLSGTSTTAQAYGNATATYFPFSGNP